MAQITSVRLYRLSYQGINWPIMSMSKLYLSYSDPIRTKLSCRDLPRRIFFLSRWKRARLRPVQEGSKPLRRKMFAVPHAEDVCQASARRPSRPDFCDGPLQLRHEEGLATADKDRPLALRCQRPRVSGHSQDRSFTS